MVQQCDFLFQRWSDDIDECNTGQASCGDNSDCTNTVGSYSCSCKTGFLQGLLGGQCTSKWTRILKYFTEKNN